MKLWYRALEQYTLDELARALLRCLREREWLSSYALAEAVRDERRERSAVRSTVLPLPPPERQVTAGPELDEIIVVFKQATAMPGDPGYGLKPEARRRVEELSRYREERLAEQSTAPRRNGGRR